MDMPKQTLRQKRGQKSILDPRWFMHLTPKELHKHFNAFDFYFRDFLGRYKDPALKWDAAGMKGAAIKVPVGSPGPVIHIIAMSARSGWRYHSIPPEVLRKVDPDAYTMINGKRARAGDIGYILAAPLIRLEVVEDPRALEAAQRYTENPSFGIGLSRLSKPAVIFTSDLGFLVTNERVHGKFSKPPQFVLYQHMIGDTSEYPENGPFYIGITQRDWKKRWGEHRSAINRGSQLKFHRVFRERLESDRLTHVNHKVMAAVETLEEIQTMEELAVDGHWGEERLLNMIPGGQKGLRFLHEHNILGSKGEMRPDKLDRLLERWIDEHPRKGLPAPWVAEKWRDDEWAAQAITSQEGRLTIDQVKAIRSLGASGQSAAKIVENVGARNVEQVERVLKGQTYSRIQ
jgi:hypothetical protein